MCRIGGVRGNEMNVKALLMTAIAFAAAVGTSHASSIRCADVVNWASVDYPPSMAVSVTSSVKTERFCRFSINGYVADSNAPAQFSEMSHPSGINAIMSGKASGATILKMLPHFLFAADKTIDMKAVRLTETALSKYQEGFIRCFNDFIRKNQAVKFEAQYGSLELQCIARESATHVAAGVFDSRSLVRRVAYIPR